MLGTEGNHVRLVLLRLRGLFRLWLSHGLLLFHYGLDTLYGRYWLLCGLFLVRGHLRSEEGKKSIGNLRVNVQLDCLVGIGKDCLRSR